MINTIHGEMDEAQLAKRERTVNGVRYVEYYLGEELVHRSAVVQLAGLLAAGIAKI